MLSLCVCGCVCACVSVVGVTTGMLSAPLLLHSQEFEYVNEMSDFTFYNGICPLVVRAQLSFRCIITESQVKDST